MVTSVPEELIQLRRDLHRHPELSGAEVETAGRIRQFLAAYPPDTLVERVGRHGLLAVYEFGEPGPCIVIRCELDALPIDEPNDLAYRSRRSGVSHKCGHDGHMTIVAGLAPWLRRCRLSRGKVVLLFQPAEENGQGAKAMLEDPKFGALQPDYVFALHNIPGFPLHQVIRVEGQFSASVISVAIRFRGLQAHAAEPENGRNPAWAMAEITNRIREWIVPDPAHPDFTLVTPVYTTMGQPDYGISAGAGELHFTLRTWTVQKMDELVRKLEQLVAGIAGDYGLETTLDYFDHFPASPNNAEANDLIVNAALAGGLDLIRKHVPFKFGEDFGWFAQKYRGAMFGLGAGMDTPVLHNPNYDFPEALISSGISLFKELIRAVLND
ncbi:amidohydrolase [Flavilitoribacter nigricans]|uniref:Amidohydrolase n=1 Tax=Flavilitoribacter nigricans (strain ATCC 23147 / DSM 23189 / NBRC 102662 / NCIMB 1420 / SS-2) TaxID=1122177 RepID=A0A2D0NJL2_FLAN2|nr:amidohydrolase [Flavilitoribacter nigricans]PHN07923.1 amidohydrolase [Flavilitoribacter nigricans DSM 23189 = NBRC 102662]